MARGALRDLDDVDPEALLEYVTGVQQICTLTESELGLFIPALHLELLKQLEHASRALKSLLETPDSGEDAALDGKMAYIFHRFSQAERCGFQRSAGAAK